MLVKPDNLNVCHTKDLNPLALNLSEKQRIWNLYINWRDAPERVWIDFIQSECTS